MMPKLHTAWLPRGVAGALEGLALQVLGDGRVMATLRADLADLHPGAVAARGTARAWVTGDATAAHTPGAAAAEAALSKLPEGPDAFVILPSGDADLVLVARSPRALHHAVHTARRRETVGPEGIREHPRAPWRMLNHWDNFSASDAMGSIERGYAGPSLFWDEGRLRDTAPLREYARLLASVGINALTVNNVNVHAAETHLITDRAEDLARLQEVFGDYGISLLVCVNFAAPMTLGDLETADPLDDRVIAWWRSTVDQLYEKVPGLGGFVVKADSEGRPGPFTYGRTQADGANLLAGALAPHGGVLFWRCFVYDSQQDWRDRTTDRARAAYDHFMALDGAFAENAILQIKYGPMDFQVREPVSPLLFSLSRTQFVVEFQVTQEYTGQQKHLVHLGPLWREALDTRGGGRSLAEVVSEGPGVHRGMTAVSNVGDSPFLTGHPLAQSNLFAFARLAWDPELAPRDVLREWAGATWPQLDTTVRQRLVDLLEGSWETYEMYTAPLGVGWMVDPVRAHYGPSVDGYEYSRWGTYHFADRNGVGVDRTAETGSGYVTQYPEDLARRLCSLETCPDEYLLFFHHVPYSHVLHDGRTVIQSIYDTHFEGFDRAVSMRDSWNGIARAFDTAMRAEVDARFEEQLRSAREWRDQICTYFWRKSGVPDEHGREIPR